MNIGRSLMFAALPFAALAASPASAGEGGGTSYLQGTRGDFGMALVGPPGVYVKNSVIYYDAQFEFREDIADLIEQSFIDQKMLNNLLTVAIVPDAKVLGGRPQLAVTLPILLDVDVTGTAFFPQGQVNRGGDVEGLGDLTITPSIVWDDGTNHFQFETKIYAPTGRWSPGAVLNLSRNRWAFDPSVSFTHLNNDTGFEISASAGVLFNTTNPATDYTDGNQFHLDATVGKHLKSGWTLGVTGYVFEQFTDDEGDIPQFVIASGNEGFRGSGAGLGPIVTKGIKIGKTQLGFEAKWIVDVENRGRIGGDIFFFTVSGKL